MRELCVNIFNIFDCRNIVHHLIQIQVNRGSSSDTNIFCKRKLNVYNVFKDCDDFVPAGDDEPVMMMGDVM